MKRQLRTHIWVRTPKLFSKVKIDTILYCHSNCGRTTIFQQDKPQMATLESLSTMEKKLSSHHFFRCHRAYLVNLEYVEHIIEKAPAAVMNDNICIPIARNRKELFLEKLMPV